MRELAIEGAWEFQPLQFPDSRGNLAIFYEADVFAAATGYRLSLSKTHHSLSKRGAIRGIHYTMLPPGQAKYVYCAYGRVIDVVVDLRLGSPTFGEYEAVTLDAEELKCVYLSDGLGHAYFAVEDSLVIYLMSTPYAPDREVAINPLDAELALPWPSDVAHVVSHKDLAAPTLAEAKARDLLPTYDLYKARIVELTEQQPQ